MVLKNALGFSEFTHGCSHRIFFSGVVKVCHPVGILRLQGIVVLLNDVRVTHGHVHGSQLVDPGLVRDLRLGSQVRYTLDHSLVQCTHRCILRGKTLGACLQRTHRCSCGT